MPPGWTRYRPTCKTARWLPLDSTRSDPAGPLRRALGGRSGHPFRARTTRVVPVVDVKLTPHRLFVPARRTCPHNIRATPTPPARPMGLSQRPERASAQPESNIAGGASEPAPPAAAAFSAQHLLPQARLRLVVEHPPSQSSPRFLALEPASSHHEAQPICLPPGCLA